MFENIETRLRSEAEEAIKDTLDLFLNKPDINTDEILQVNEPVPETEIIGADRASELEEVLSDILEDKTLIDNSDSLQNAFTDVLKHEYCRGNKSLSSKMNSIIDMIYMKKDRFTKEQYRELNSLIYDTVMELFLYQDNIEHTTIDLEVTRARRFGGIYQTEDLDDRFIKSVEYKMSLVKTLVQDLCYTPKLSKHDKNKVYLDWDKETNAGAFTIKDNYSSSFAERVEKVIKQYNMLVGEDEKLDDEVLSQLHSILPSSDTFNFGALNVDMRTVFTTMCSALGVLQDRIALTCLFSLPTFGKIFDLSSEGYSIRSDSPIRYDRVLFDSCKELYDAPEVRDLIDKYFHRETALEDLLNLMWFAISYSGEVINKRMEESISIRSALSSSVLLCDSFSDERAEKQKHLADYLKALLSPLKCKKFGSVRTSAPIYTAPKLSANQWYGKVRNNYALINRLPAILAVASGEAVLEELSSLSANELLDKMRNHPVYKFMKEHDDCTIEQIQEILGETKFEPIFSSNEYKETLPNSDVVDLAVAYVGKIFAAFSRLASAMSIIMSLISHKIFATNVGAIFGLSSDLVHVLLPDYSSNTYIARSWAYLYSDMGRNLIQEEDINSANSLIKEKASNIKQEFCDDPSKFLLVLMDSPSAIMHTGAPVVHNQEEIVESQNTVTTLRNRLRESFYVITNTKEYSEKEIKYMLAVNEFKANPGMTKYNCSRAKAINRKLVSCIWCDNNSIDTKIKEEFEIDYYNSSLCKGYFPAVTYTNKRFYSDPVKPLSIAETLVDTPFSGTVLTYFGSKSYCDTFTVRDCIIPNKNFKDTAYLQYDHRAMKWDNSQYSPEVIKENGLFEQDPAIVFGGGLGCDFDANLDKTTPNTIWTSSYICRLTQGNNRLTNFPKSAQMIATLCSVDVSPKIAEPRFSYVSYVSNPFRRKGALHLFPTGARLLANKFTLEDLLKVQKIEIPVEEEQTLHRRVFHRTRTIALNWRYIYQNRHEDPNNSIGKRTLKKIEQAASSSPLCSEDYTFLGDYTDVYLSDIGKFMIMHMYTNDISKGLVFFGDLTEMETPESIKSKAMKLSDWVAESRVIQLEPIRAAELAEESSNQDLHLITSEAELSESNEAYLTEEQKKEAAVDIVQKYNKYILDNVQAIKLHPAESKVSSLEKEVELLEAKLRLAKKKVVEINTEIERLTKEGLDGGLGTHNSVQSKLKRLINKGYVLDYNMNKTTGNMVIVTRAPVIWVGGLIYTFSPAMIQLKLGADYLLDGVHDSSGRPTIFATKDLQYMIGEAYRLFGSKHGLHSCKEMTSAAQKLSLGINSYTDVYDYPHVHHGSGCLGDLISLFKQNLRDGDIAEVISSILYYLNTVNIEDAWGSTIRYWPAIPATMFNLLRCGLLQDMEEYRNQYIVIPGKYLSVERSNCYWYSLIHANLGSDEDIPAMLSIKDMTPEILQYLYDEASCLQSMGYEHDYDYLRSFSDDYWYRMLVSSISPFLGDPNSIASKYKSLKDPDVKAYLDTFVEYAYNIYQPASTTYQERSWRFLENSIVNIDVWKKSIRYIPEGDSFYNNRLLECSRRPLKAELSEDKVIITN